MPSASGAQSDSGGQDPTAGTDAPAAGRRAERPPAEATRARGRQRRCPKCVFWKLEIFRNEHVIYVSGNARIAATFRCSLHFPFRIQDAGQ